MNPDYIYFKEIDIDQDETFPADFAKKKKKNEIENVVFNKENEYGITSLNINSILPESKILKIENEKKKQKKKLVMKYKN